MDKTSTSSAAIVGKRAAYYPLLEERVKQTVRTAKREAVHAVQEAGRIFRIVVFLHSANDFPSVLRLYGIEDSCECGTPNEKQC
jgi:hypothetical protein